MVPISLSYITPRGLQAAYPILHREGTISLSYITPRGLQAAGGCGGRHSTRAARVRPPAQRAGRRLAQHNRGMPRLLESRHKFQGS
jgi:hypothetical protein